MMNAHIHTFGCQMNEHDSRKMAEILVKQGYEIVSDPKQADLILVNTCSVRENPVNKVYSFLGRLKPMKQRHPGLIIGVAGCVAQQAGEEIIKRDKAVDLVFGPDYIFSLPEMLYQVKKGARIVQTEWQPRQDPVQDFIPEDALEEFTINGCKASIAITKGCNNHCSFCIVPTTRGRLVSRQPDQILAEARFHIRKGIKEILLLGQNVNAYQAEKTGFLELLEMMVELEGLCRLRFTSPHPNAWTSRLTDLMADQPVICPQIHLPFQSGSDRVLRRMNRGHTIGAYLKTIEYLKKRIPDSAISTDIIVGFPGESESDFQQTLQLLKAVEFTQVYAFMYSERAGTRAATLEESVPRGIREERLQRLLAVQQPIQSALLDQQVGSWQEVLIDSVHPREPDVMTGRNKANIPVAVYGSDIEIGNLIDVRISGRKKHSLTGTHQRNRLA